VLGGADEIELPSEGRRRKQIVIDVGDDREPVFAAQHLIAILNVNMTWTRSGFSARILSTFAEVKALTRGFSRRACGGRTTYPEMPTMRSCSPSRYSVSTVSQPLSGGVYLDHVSKIIYRIDG
jgi:hypothetical protein